jgi:hypothetical protein
MASSEQNAILNLVTAGQEFAGGFTVGGLLSSGQAGVGKALDAGQQKAEAPTPWQAPFQTAQTAQQTQCS